MRSACSWLDLSWPTKKECCAAAAIDKVGAGSVAAGRHLHALPAWLRVVDRPRERVTSPIGRRRPSPWRCFRHRARSRGPVQTLVKLLHPAPVASQQPQPAAQLSLYPSDPTLGASFAFGAFHRRERGRSFFSRIESDCHQRTDRVLGFGKVLGASVGRWLSDFSRPASESTPSQRICGTANTQPVALLPLPLSTV